VGEVVTIEGSGFPDPQPPDMVVLFGDVPAEVVSWSADGIQVVVPPGAKSCCVGFRDERVEQSRRQEFAHRQGEFGGVLEGLGCLGQHVQWTEVSYVASRPPCTAANHFAGTMPEIDSFGVDAEVVLPDSTLTLQWQVRNADQVRVFRASPDGPPVDLLDPPGDSHTTGPFTGDRPVEARYELHATNRCGTVVAGLKVLLRKVPVLHVTGVEVTQAVQAFQDPGTPPNSVPLVAGKDTIVRVYVAVDNLAGFKVDGVHPDEVEVSGVVSGPGLGGLPPVNTGPVRARPTAQIDRTKTDHTLNFRLPAAWSTGNRSLVISVWATNSVQQALAPKAVATATAFHGVTWFAKAAFKVRYVRLSIPTMPALSDQQARERLLRAFDLLATPATDILPARIATAHTTRDIDTSDGVAELLSDIDDAHDCTLSEWVLPWEDDCPDDDKAVWVGVLPRNNWGGKTQGFEMWGPSRNTCIVPLDRTVIAHELGHSLGLHHANTSLTCGGDPAGPYDSLTDGGAIRPGDPIDPATGQVIDAGSFGTPSGLYDMMTYQCPEMRWISRHNWLSVFNKF